MAPRRIVYLTGTRADYGLMRSVLKALDAHDDVALELIVTGTHLSPAFGETISEIVQDQFDVRCRIPVDVDAGDGAAMTAGMGRILTTLAEEFARERPDLLVVLGDRGEMLAGAIAALHEGIHVAHIHGGERSGTVDDSVRHAISKLSHFHLVATARSRERLIRLGEEEEKIFLTGAPGLDGIDKTAAGADYAAICREYGLSQDRPVALVVFHPVVQTSADMDRQTRELINALGQMDLQALWLLPNSDAGRHAIAEAVQNSVRPGVLQTVTHLSRIDFLCVMSQCDVMVGNSSAGIIEAASFDTPVVNIGDRQNARERSANTLDCDPEAVAILKTIEQARRMGRKPVTNVYSQPGSVAKIVRTLTDCPLHPTVLKKLITY